MTNKLQWLCVYIIIYRHGMGLVSLPMYIHCLFKCPERMGLLTPLLSALPQQSLGLVHFHFWLEVNVIWYALFDTQPYTYFYIYWNTLFLLALECTLNCFNFTSVVIWNPTLYRIYNNMTLIAVIVVRFMHPILKNMTVELKYCPIRLMIYVWRAALLHYMLFNIARKMTN